MLLAYVYFLFFVLCIVCTVTFIGSAIVNHFFKD